MRKLKASCGQLWEAGLQIVLCFIFPFHVMLFCAICILYFIFLSAPQHMEFLSQGWIKYELQLQLTLQLQQCQILDPLRGQNPHLSSNSNHCRDNARFLTHCTYHSVNCPIYIFVSIYCIYNENYFQNKLLTQL